jgi:hypothetical protein
MSTKIKIKKGKAARKKEQFWPMKVGGPYSKTEGDAKEIYKCTGCGAETETEQGWNGAPNKHICRPGCACLQSDWTPGAGYSPQGKQNFDRIFPNAPGVGL